MKDGDKILEKFGAKIIEEEGRAIIICPKEYIGKEVMVMVKKDYFDYSKELTELWIKEDLII